MRWFIIAGLALVVLVLAALWSTLGVLPVGAEAARDQAERMVDAIQLAKMTGAWSDRTGWKGLVETGFVSRWPGEDPWGRPFRVRVEGDGRVFVASAGEDGAWDTPDDIEVTE